MESELKALGLNDKEIEVFISLLKKGTTTSNQIAKLLQKPRSSIYDTLQMLANKGFVNFSVDSGKTYYHAVEPTQILQQEEDRIYGLRKAVPELEAVKNKSEAGSKIEIYHGLKGVSSMLNEVYHTKEIWVYGSGQKTDKYMGHLPRQLAVKRSEEKIRMKLMMEKSPHSTFRIDEKKLAKYTELRVVREMKDYPALTFITEKCVAIVMTGDEILGLLIRNKAFVETQKYLFEYFWKKAKTYHSKS